MFVIERLIFFFLPLLRFLEEKELGEMGGGRLLYLFGGGLKKK